MVCGRFFAFSSLFILNDCPQSGRMCASISMYVTDDEPMGVRNTKGVFLAMFSDPLEISITPFVHFASSVFWLPSLLAELIPGDFVACMPTEKDI